jgi:aryl-alcohol dehydrogenase-like predicted oxidoreductase
MEYGIANTTGKPDLPSCRAIIAAALGGGVTTFDTAPTYGDSERLLGACLGADAGIVISKLPALDWSKGRAAALGSIRASIEASLASLRRPRIDGYLFHSFADIDRDGRAALAELERAHTEGLLGCLGASVYTPEEADACLAIDSLELIQVPFSLADRRLVESGFLERSRKAGRTVIARSVFLKGLLVADRLPAELSEAEPFRAQARRLAEEAKMSVAELCLRHVLGVEGIDSVLVGVETLGQLSDNLAMAARGPLPRELRAEVDRLPSLPAWILHPFNWQHLSREATAGKETPC